MTFILSFRKFKFKSINFFISKITHIIDSNNQMIFHQILGRKKNEDDLFFLSKKIK